MPTKAECWQVPKGSSLRLDRFVADRFPDISRAYIQELIGRGLVQVNGKRVRKGEVVSEGDNVTVDSFILPQERRIDPNPEIPLDIVWKSDDFLVINKPAGLPTHPNDYKDRHSLANALIAHFPIAQGVGDDALRPGIVHRLDTDTSGLLLVALTESTFRQLRKLFDERKVKKKYLALVLGEVRTKGRVDTPVAHHPKNPRKMIVAKPGVTVRSQVREAVTEYEPLEKFKGYTLLVVQTKSGRMHQVRVHLSSIGHPLAGDRIYQTPKDRQTDRSELKRHFLHASEIAFPLPSSNRVKTFTVSLPSELEALLADLRKRETLEA